MPSCQGTRLLHGRCTASVHVFLRHPCPAPGEPFLDRRGGTAVRRAAPAAPAGISRHRRMPRGERPNLEQVRALGFEPHVFPLNGSMLSKNTFVQVARMAALIRSEGVKIVHATDFNTNLLGLLAARIGGAKVIVSRLDLDRKSTRLN